MKLAILFGSSSYEHEISIVSAVTLKKVLKDTDLLFIFVDAKRELYLIDNEKMKASTFRSGEYKRAKKLTLKQGGFFQEGLLGVKKLTFDAVLNLIHGRDGEDGKIASLMTFFGIPFIGPRIEASFLSYNKLYTKLYAKEVGVEVLGYVHVSKGKRALLQKEELIYPCIVKPVRLGSSIGVTIVKSIDALEYALDVAFEFDDDVIIEPFIEGVKEYNLAGAYTNEWEFSIVEEPQKEEFLDFEKKYMDFSRDEKVQKASIDTRLELKLKEVFQKIYDPLFRGSIIRCDFFVVNETIYLNEINPIPGSMANYLFDDFRDLVGRVVQTLPKKKPIKIEYSYIDTIHKAKGKA